MKHIRMVALAACAGAVLAACGGTTDSNDGGSGFEPTTSGPIEIGVLITDTRAEAERNGISIVNPYRDAVHAMVDAVNADGGVKDRQLSVVDDVIDFSAPDHDIAFEAVCQRFTEDNHVQAVLYDGIIYNQSFVSCLTNAGVPILYMGQTGSPVGDAKDFEDNPGLVAVNGVSLDRRVESVMNMAIAADYLKSGDKVGVVIEECPYNTRVYDGTLKSIADHNGIELIKAAVNCSHGYDDAGPALAQIQSFALKLKSEGADSVIFLTLYENGLIYYLAQAAEAQNWSPQYLLFHPQGNADALKIYPPNQLTEMRGFGGFPIMDVTTPPAPDSAQADVREGCLADARAAGLAVQTISDQITVFQACDAVRLLQQGLENSGGLGGTEKLVAGIEQIGTGFVSALTMNGATKFGPGRHYGMVLTAASTYDDSCTCVKYTTDPEPIE